MLIMEKSASTTIGKWSQRKAGLEVAGTLIAFSIIQQVLSVAHPIFRGSVMIL